MEHTAIFQEQIPLLPRDMRKKITSLDETIQEKLRDRLEGKCSRNGFVVPGTLKVLSRSMGIIEKGRFTGSVLFYTHAEGTVLNPPDGAIVEGEVVRKNKMGMYVSYQLKLKDETIDAIKIIVPRDLHIGNDEYESVQLGQRVSVEIKKSRFQVNDPYILSVGIFQGVVSRNSRVAAAAPVAPMETGPQGGPQEGGEGEEEEDVFADEGEGEDEGEAEEEEDYEEDE